MKKIYSIVLMATALLIGTNAWAKDFSGNAAQLQKAIADIIHGAESDPVIKLQNNVELNGTIWVGTEKLSDTYKSITLDLNGYSITYNSQTATNRTLIALTHGELKIINTAANEATLGLTGNAADGSTIVSVYGSYRSSRWNEDGTDLEGEGTNTRVEGWCSHLEIGSNVKLYAEHGCQGTGLYVGPNDLKYPKADGTLAATAYPGWVMTGSIYSFTHGVRVDFHGKIDFQGTNDGKAYGIKVNGTLRSPLSWANSGYEAFQEKYTNSTKSTYIPYIANYLDHNAAIDKNATLATDATHKRDTVDAPFIWIHPGAEIKTRDAGNKVTALYAAGYAKWLVQGYAAGKTGMYVSSGVLDLSDAYVKSTADEWQNTSNIGSANGGGSGVVLNSRDSYSGDIEFTVSGDTKIESIKGYAIEEAVNTTVVVPNPEHETNPEAPETIPATNVSNITINGGTIEGGDKGAIIISGPTNAATKAIDEDAKSTVVVYGGNVEGTTVVGASGDLDEITATGTHTTEVTVTDPTTGQEKTVVVVSKGDPLDEGNKVSNQQPNTSVKWVGADYETDKIESDLKLAELEINDVYTAEDEASEASHVAGTPRPQVLTIADGATFEVGRVVLGSKAKIIVEPGAKFIVTGEQGIVAPSVDNIVLQASATDQAVFLFNPAVISNRHPNATVQMYAKAHHATDGTWYSQHFGIPTFETPAITWAPGTTYLYKWEESGWVNITALSQLEPFRGYSINNTSETAAGVYTFKGELNGNTDAPLKFVKPYYNLVANSYAAPMDLKAVFTDIQSQYGNDVELTAWIYKSDEDRHVSITQASVASDENPKAIKTIAPMQGFILYCGASQPANGSIRYKESVWDNPNKTGVPIMAPAHKGNDNSVRATIVVSTEKSKDEVVLRESDEYSSAFDNGADAHKYMSERVFDLYSENNGENYSNVATDNLAGTTLTLQAKNETAYTMSFCNVNNFNYVLRDNLSGAIISIEEGATYDFFMAEGTTANGRFEIIERNEVPTAIDNVEATRAAKGIYTILGQYVGESSLLNTLPSGIYVVDGQRIVK